MKMAKDKLTADASACTVTHYDIVRRVKKRLPEDELLFDLAELFKVFGDSTRVRIICALLYAEMCVCDITVLLGMSQSAISHQLKALRQARLVKSRRDGRVIFYSLDDRHIESIFRQGLAHVSETDKK
jgi:ArsR family transcriptional regulator